LIKIDMGARSTCARHGLPTPGIRGSRGVAGSASLTTRRAALRPSPPREAPQQNGQVGTNAAGQQSDRDAGGGRLVGGLTLAGRRRVELVLAGELDERELSAEERVTFDAELNTAISRTARSLRFGEVLAARGVTTAALDERGRLMRYRPDGTASPLA
jgi:hypothetical protein